MNLAALPTRALKVPTDRCSQSCMVITRYELHTPKAPGLERSEDLLVGSFTLRIRHRHSEYFAVTVSPDPRHDQHPQADHLMVDPDMFVASIHHQVRVLNF